MKKYKHNVSTYEVLLWESELTPKPEEHLITMPAQEGDLAWVSDEGKEYVFKEGVWIEYEDIPEKYRQDIEEEGIIGDKA